MIGWWSTWVSMQLNIALIAVASVRTMTCGSVKVVKGCLFASILIVYYYYCTAIFFFFFTILTFYCIWYTALAVVLHSMVIKLQETEWTILFDAFFQVTSLDKKASNSNLKPLIFIVVSHLVCAPIFFRKVHWHDFNPRKFWQQVAWRASDWLLFR